MPFVIIGIVLLVIFITIYQGILPKIKRKKLIQKVENYLKKIGKDYTLKILEKDIYDIDLVVENKHLVIKILIVPDYSEIQVNSKETWEVKYGAGDTPGKVQPHKRFLNEVSTFQKTNFPIDITKIVLISPKPKKIVKYINECEIIFVKPSTDIYGSYIATEDTFGIFLK